MATRSPPRLHRVIARLIEQHGRQAPPPANTAFALVLWEKVAYLAPDERRARAFEMLRTRVGLTPQAILAARRLMLVMAELPVASRAFARDRLLGAAEPSCTSCRWP